jgi:hypothetical protein
MTISILHGTKIGKVRKFRGVEMICSIDILYFSFMISNKTRFVDNEKVKFR